MKKLLSLLFAILLFPAFAATYNAVSKVEGIGKAIIAANSLPSKTTFKVVEGIADNSNVSSTMIINISKEELSTSGNDNEVAAVVAHNMGEIILGTAAKNKLGSYIQPNSENSSTVTNIVANRISTADDKDADIIGVDLMIKANYNPLAAIVVLTKGQASTLEALTGKPANSERAMNIYDYLTYNYPEKIKAGYNCQEYRAFLVYAEPIVKERNSNKKKLAKFNKEQQKAKEKRQKKINQYKTTGGVSGWDATYNILNNLTVK